MALPANSPDPSADQKICVGCAYRTAPKLTHYINDYPQLVESQQYALASAILAYERSLQFYNPQEDLLEYLKACAPIACQDYGKTISHYGGLRITPEQDVEYAGWSKAKQLAWDRAYDENNELCYICYNGAGNSAYAGFMKILHGRKRRELCNGVDSPREELLGDTFELAIGMLTLAMRYRGIKVTNACVRRGKERGDCRHLSNARRSLAGLHVAQPPEENPVHEFTAFSRCAM